MPSTITPASKPTLSSPTPTSAITKLLHPCLRVFGKCNFGAKCKFAQLPANCCLSFLKKGQCASKNCKYPHLSSATAAPVVSSSKTFPPSSLVNSTTTNHDVQAEENEITDLMMILSPSFEDSSPNDDDDSPSFEDELLIPENFFSSSSSPLLSQQKQQQVTTPAVVDETVLLKNKCDSLDKEITSLKITHANAIARLQAQHDTQIKAEREKTVRLQKELEEAKQHIELQKDSFRLFREQLPELIINKFLSSAQNTAAVDDKPKKSDTNDDDDDKQVPPPSPPSYTLFGRALPEMFFSNFLTAKKQEDTVATATTTALVPPENNKKNENVKLADIIIAELSSLHQSAEIEALCLRRMSVLSKAFDVANEKFTQQQKGYKAANQYSPLIPNECLFSDVSPVAQTFSKACSDATLVQELFDKVTGEFNTERFEIVFHGTKSVEAALAIQCGGLDPNRRRGQAMGPGEYSAVHLATAMGYSAGMMLAFLVYKPPSSEKNDNKKKGSRNNYGGVQKFGPVNQHSNGIFVVENAKDKSSTHMLPLGCSYLYSQHQVKTVDFKRKCTCAQKKAEIEFKKGDRTAENSKAFNGKRIFYKEKDCNKDSSKDVEYKQLNAGAAHSLLKVLYSSNKNGAATTPTTASAGTNKKKSNKNTKNNKKCVQQQQAHHQPPCFAMIAENEPCSVDMGKLEMVNLRSGKVYSLAVW